MVNKKIILKPKEKLLKYLIENKEPLSIRETSAAIAVDYKNVYGYVTDLTASGAIVQEVMGNTTPIQINLSPHQEIFNVEQKRTEEFFANNSKLKVIQEYIKEINYPFMIVLIFGSYAKSKNSSASDIDLCIISDNKNKVKELIGLLEILSLKLEIHDFTTEQFVSMISKNEKNLGHEIIKNNVLLYGTENYYNLISKWTKKE